MSTQIKKNGNWVTVAGGTRMWVGTKAALQAALDAGELVDGTAVMVTDDYEEAYHPHPDWANAVAITAAQLYAGYTAPSDGMFVGAIYNSSTSNNYFLTLNGTNMMPLLSLGTNTLARPLSLSLIINKGDTIGCTIPSASDITVYPSINFVPWK